jgi:hypothetical protein
MDITWPLSAAVVCLMILQASLARDQLGSWLAPGAFFGLMWATVGVLSLSITPEFKIWPGVLWIFFMSCTAHLAGLLASSGESPKAAAAEETSKGPPLPLAVPFLIASTVLGTAGVVYLVAGSGRSLMSIISINAASVLASYFSGLRYSDPNYREPALFLVLSVFIYLAGYMGGMIFARATTPQERLAAVSGVGPALLQTFVIGARTTLVAFAICWISSYCATRAYCGERRLWYSWRRALISLGSGVLALVVVYVVVQMARMGIYAGGDPLDTAITSMGASSVSSQEQKELVKFSIRTAEVQFVGYAAAFSRWFDENWDVWQAPDLGLNCFDGPAGWFGISMVRNAEPINVAPNANTSSEETNVFSALRQMAFDWTLPGSSIFFLIFTFMASLAYVKVCGQKAAYIPLIVLYYEIGLYVTSFALRNTVTDAAWILFAGYMWLASGAGLRGYSHES